MLGNVRLLADELRAQRIVMPLRTTATGKTIGGVPFSRGVLYATLRRVTYDGQIQHCDKVFAGNHPAIVDHATFVAVQHLLTDHSQGERRRGRRPSGSVLAGRIVDAHGAPLVATHASKPVLSNVEGGNSRYRYYVSRALHRKEADTGLRIPAREIERVVAQRMAAPFDDPLALAEAAGLAIDVDRLERVHTNAARIAAELRSHPRQPLLALLAKVTIKDTQVVIDTDTAAIAQALDLPCPADPGTLTITTEARIARAGVAVRPEPG